MDKTNNLCKSPFQRTGKNDGEKNREEEREDIKSSMKCYKKKAL